MAGVVMGADLLRGHRKKVPESRIEGAMSRRKDVIERFGIMPYSVLRLKRGALSGKMFNLQSESPREEDTQAKRRARREATGLNAVVPFDGVGRERRSLSIMPAELVDFFIKYYAKAGDVYLDPFMGQGIQLQVAALRGLEYHGYDICERFVEFIQHVCQKIQPTTARPLRATLGDSRHPDTIPDGIGDFSFHSPPYWDVEYYGDEPEQLGEVPTYAEFLALIGEVARAWLPKFKSGAFHVVNVHDLRRDGVFYCYHADLLREFVAAGWVAHDIWIIENLVSGLSKMFAARRVHQRVAPKVHAYALVFRAP